MSETANILVRYEGNARDNVATESLSFRALDGEEQRKPIKLGDTGYVTQTEFERLGALGVVVSVVPAAEAKEEGKEQAPQGQRPPANKTSTGGNAPADNAPAA